MRDVVLVEEQVAGAVEHGVAVGTCADLETAAATFTSEATVHSCTQPILVLRARVFRKLLSGRWFSGCKQTKMTRSVDEQRRLALGDLIVEPVPDPVAKIQVR